jgi:hypothetical protein
MSEEHKPLPVSGYTPQSDAKVALVNSFKEDEERLLRKLDKLQMNPQASQLASSIKPGEFRELAANEQILTDPRFLALARTHLQIGFMALNRAVFQPQRIRLPEDE